MRRIRGPDFVAVLLLCSIVPLFAGCGGKGSVSASATDAAMTAVLKRHDAAVALPSNPLGLNEVEKSTALRSSALLREAWDTALQRGVVAVRVESQTSPVLPDDRYAPILTEFVNGRLVGCTVCRVLPPSEAAPDPPKASKQ